MANGTARDKARKARDLAYDAKHYWRESEKIASDVAKGATGKKLTMREEERAGKIIQQRRMNDTGKTARRAEFIADRTSKRSAAARKVAAVSGGVAPKKATPKAASSKTVGKKSPMPKTGKAMMGRKNTKKGM